MSKYFKGFDNTMRPDKVPLFVTPTQLKALHDYEKKTGKKIFY